MILYYWLKSRALLPIAMIAMLSYGTLCFAGDDCLEQSAESHLLEKMEELPISSEKFIDRDMFWRQVKEIAAKKEIFRFSAKKKLKTGGYVWVKKEVVLRGGLQDDPTRSVIEAIINRWEYTGGGNPKHLALMLGTAYRETCGWMQASVGEACGCSKKCSVDELKTAVYGRKDKCGRSYFGRGLVQLTGRYNYQKTGERLKVPLVDYPNLAYQESVAVKLLVDGVKGGWFAGKPLDFYLNETKSDWVSARDSVNPGSPNKVATGYLSCRFYDALRFAYKSKVPLDSIDCMGLKNI